MEAEGLFPSLQYYATCPYPTQINRVHTYPSYLFNIYLNIMPVPVAARSKAYVCGRSPPGIVGSNPTGGHGRLSVVIVVCCHVEVSAAS